MLGCLVALVAYYSGEFAERYEGYTRRWFFGWLTRGIGAPLFVWLMLNWGTMPFLPPLNPYIAQLRAKGFHAQALGIQILLAAIPIVSYWAALSFGWFLTTLFKRAQHNEDVIIALLVASPLVLLVGWVFAYLTGWYGLGLAVVICAWPLTQYLLIATHFVKPPPSYSRALGKIKFGKYGEAELAIIGELEKSETDFDGWMMLAELYAQQYHDLPEAEKTIYEVCSEPATTPSQISLALQRLADWYLKLGGDPGAARRVLEDLCARVTGTHLALMARQRLNQIPASRAELDELQKPQTFAMPALNDSLDDPRESESTPISREAALVTVNQLVEKLNQDPNDIIAREKLARVFAGHLEKFALAIEQIELLLGMPEQPERKVAEWLALQATWHIKLHGEGEQAKRILERLIREFPQSAQAFAAQRRLSLMNMSVKMRPHARRAEKET